MLQIKNLSVTHKKDLRPLLENFSFSLNAGDKAVIISEEGNGKSTLLKLIYDPGLVEGYAEYTGEILTGSTLLGYLPQEFPRECKEQTIYSLYGRSGFFGGKPRRPGSHRCTPPASQGYILF